MAYSPSPQSAAQPAAGSAGNSYRSYMIDQGSKSPPVQQPVNKRDKRRTAMADRLAEICNNFAVNRDVYYRKQLSTLQQDINYINKAKLYDDTPLPEFGEDSLEEANVSAAASTSGSIRQTQQAHLNGSAKLEAAPQTGRHTARFVQEVNDAMEKRDADLAVVASHHNFAIESLQKDFTYSVAVARQEHQRLMETLRQRLLQNVQQKRTALQREKEKLDIADASTLLYHPSQFSINNAASPGGLQSNRKTRHTRHRLEIDDLDTAVGNNNKRKRKVPADTETGSPSREMEPANGYKGSEGRHEGHSAAAPLYSLDRLFSERELNTHLQQANYDILQSFSAKRRKTADGNGSVVPTNGEPTDLEDDDAAAEQASGGDAATDDIFLTAPEMERTITNTSYHATRSTRNLNNGNGTARENLGELAGRHAAADMIGTYQKEKKRDDEYQRAPPLTESEMADDLALMAKAMREESTV